ncbi:uncharacterized protein LOC144103704 [Amblyomma americanum]
MASAMAERFKPYGWLCRAAGAFYIQNLQAANTDDMVITWRCWYSLYSLVCLLAFSTGELVFVANNLRRLYATVRHFTRSLVVVIPAVVIVKVVVNIASAIFGSWAMLEFFKKSAEHERRTGFDRKEHRYGCRLSYLLRFFIVASFLVHQIANANITVRMLDAEGNSFFEFALKSGMLLFNFLFFIYDMLHFIVLRPCCEGLISYVLQEQNTLKSILESDYVFVAKLSGVTELERVRINVATIANLRRVLNGAWQYSIMTSAVVLLTMSCICIYGVFDEGVPTDQLLLTMSYCFCSTVDLIDIARLSQTMANEVQRLKESLMKVTMFHDSPVQFRQVAYLHNSLLPEDMFLSGGNFFNLNLPLLVSLAGSVITYSVILVQTSDSMEHMNTPRINSSASET